MMKPVALALLMLGMMAQAIAKDYVYTDFAVPMDDSDGAFSMRLDMTAKIERHGHTGGRLHVCADNEEFYCFMDGGLSFAVPRVREPRIGDHWKYMKSEFSVDSAQSLQILGIKKDVLIISSQFSPKRRDVFYYSTTEGLLAMKFEQAEQETTQVYLLAGAIGFPF